MVMMMMSIHVYQATCSAQRKHLSICFHRVRRGFLCFFAVLCCCCLAASPKAFSALIVGEALVELPLQLTVAPLPHTATTSEPSVQSLDSKGFSICDYVEATTHHSCHSRFIRLPQRHGLPTPTHHTFQLISSARPPPPCRPPCPLTVRPPTSLPFAPMSLHHDRAHKSSFSKRYSARSQSTQGTVLEELLLSRRVAQGRGERLPCGGLRLLVAPERLPLAVHDLPILLLLLAGHLSQGRRHRRARTCRQRWAHEVSNAA